MYLLEEHPDNRDYVLGRLRETLRFVNKNYEKTRANIPVFVYHRNIYEDNPFAFNFLSKVSVVFFALIYIPAFNEGLNKRMDADLLN